MPSGPTHASSSGTPPAGPPPAAPLPPPRIPPAAWFVAALALMMTLDAALPGPRWLDRPWTLAGAVVATGGAALHIAATNAFRRRRTTAAALARPAALVVDGPYRFSRNPMYLGGVLMLLGLGTLLGATTPLLVIPLWMLLVQERYIRREEALLMEAFGETYKAYGAGVRRWI